MNTNNDNASEWYADGLRFTCTQCGNCCTGSPGYVWFTDEEAAAMAGYLNVDLETFYDRYTHVAYQRRSLNETPTEYGYDCIFLRRDDQGKAMCSIYPVRPRQCQTWPFWPENLASPRSWQRAAENCPGMQQGTAGKGRLYPIEAIRIQRDSN